AWTPVYVTLRRGEEGGGDFELVTETTDSDDVPNQFVVTLPNRLGSKETVRTYFRPGNRTARLTVRLPKKGGGGVHSLAPTPPPRPPAPPRRRPVPRAGDAASGPGRRTRLCGCRGQGGRAGGRRPQRPRRPRPRCRDARPLVRLRGRRCGRAADRQARVAQRI